MRCTSYKHSVNIILFSFVFTRLAMTENNFEKVCRICIKEASESVHLFDTKLSDSGTFVVDFLRQITNLEIIETDGLSNILCIACLQKLCNAFELVQMCISSDIILRNTAKDEFTEILEINCDSKDQNDDSLKSEESVTEDEPEENTNLPKSVKYACDICNIFFNNKTKYNKHKKTHDDSNPFKCNECSQTFSKKLHLNVHLRSHTKDEDKKFICKSCNKQFMYEYQLKQHEYKHTDEKPYPCKFCSKGCLTAESLKRHMKIHDKNYVKKKHSCQICFQEFAYPSFLAEHMKNHTGEKPHLCSICGKGFRQSGALHYHQRVHTGYKPFVCKICNGNFMSQSVLKVHMRKHTNERPYVCHICGMAFRQSTDLKSHQRTHTGDKPVLCTICGKRMSTTGQLTIHIRSHTGEKPFACSCCSKAFTTKTMLVKHERIHTGERPYVCDICGRAFNQSSTLRTHRNTHQNNKKRKKSERQKEKSSTNEVSVEKDYTSASCVIYKNDIVNLGTEIVAEEFMSDSVQDIEVKSTDGSVKTQFTVILPAPIPLLQNL
ncbi:hypothetical protein MTP99_010650 [Tenebrio molitor]|nr:hypothetical protein MTP99_010650 [Tenebrio molitor]